MENEKDVREMTAETIGADLLQALLTDWNAAHPVV